MAVEFSILRIRLVVWLAAGVLTLAACSKGQEAVEGFAEIQGAACECDDPDCANRLLTRFLDAADELKGVRVTGRQGDKLEEMTVKTLNCLLEAGVSRERFDMAVEDLTGLTD